SALASSARRHDHKSSAANSPAEVWLMYVPARIRKKGEAAASSPAISPTCRSSTSRPRQYVTATVAAPSTGLTSQPARSASPSASTSGQPMGYLPTQCPLTISTNGVKKALLLGGGGAHSAPRANTRAWKM